eukprot:contig_17774_g4361
MESTQKAISAAMTDYFSALKCVGRWQTGRDADGHVTFSGHPNKSDAVDAVKRNHLKALATRGCVVMPVDPFEVGQAAAYYDEHISGSAAIDPEKLGDLCLSLLSMNLLLRFDEASKIKREHVRRSRDPLGSLTFMVDIREITKNSLHGHRYRLESWPGIAGDPRVDPVLILGAHLLVRGEKPGYLFGASHRDRRGNLFMNAEKKMDADALMKRFRADLTAAGVDLADWMGTHSFKRGGVQLLKQLGVDDAAIKEHGRWSTMAAYFAYLAVCNRLEKRRMYASPMAALVDVFQQGGATAGTEIHALLVEMMGKTA